MAVLLHRSRSACINTNNINEPDCDRPRWRVLSSALFSASPCLNRRIKKYPRRMQQCSICIG
ncbi:MULTISPECIES: hypothetical protein [unclassified Microcoleus]|uniref:hypothetical protein n=1 Tax=unclassified Microcoleus TaxID=2642155 RepID=UPI002FCFC3AB